MPPIRRSKSTASRRNTPSTWLDLNQLTAEVLRLRCGQLKLSATGSRRTLLARRRAAPQQAVAANPLNPVPSQHQRNRRHQLPVLRLSSTKQCNL